MEEYPECAFCHAMVDAVNPHNSLCLLCERTAARAMHNNPNEFAPQDVFAMQAENMRTNSILFVLTTISEQLRSINETLGEGKRGD